MRKGILIALAMIMGLNLSSCGVSDMESNKEVVEQKNYKEVALDFLKNKYGEEFEIKQEGGTFAALSNTKKLICNPVNNKDKYCFVQVSKDLKEVQDNYIHRLADDKFADYVEGYAKELFGEEIIIKPYIDGYYDTYNSLDIDIVKFMEGETGTYGMDVFIKSDGNIDKEKEAEKIYDFAKYILDNSIKNRGTMIIWYMKEETYENIDKEYHKLKLRNEENEYYSNENKIYNRTGVRIRDGNEVDSIDEIMNTFKY